MKQTLISLCIIFFIGCGKSPDNEYLVKLKKINIKVPEPSGLTFSNDMKSLITVSDANSTIYWLDFEGNVKKKIKSDGYDYEGVTFTDKNTIAVALEELQEIKLITEEGKLLFTKKTDIKGDRNAGFEGIAFNRKTHHTFIANEKNPRTIIELDDSLRIISRTNINFLSDISGLFYELKNDILWIVSDESRTVAKCDSKGNLIKKYKIKVEKAEGIAVDIDKKLIYIVSDIDESLHIFELPND